MALVQWPGFRFYPTDLELVAGFLAHKVHGHSGYLGADWAGDPIIPTVDLYGKDDEAYPWRVCQRLACPHSTGSTEFYCFTPRRKKLGDKPDRTVGASGTWHSNGSGKCSDDDANKIYDGGVLVGHKVNLTFKILPPAQAGAGSGESKTTTCRRRSATKPKKCGARRGGSSRRRRRRRRYNKC